MQQDLRMLSALLTADRVTLSASDVEAMPEVVRRYFLNEGVVVPTRSATHLVCDACHDDHVEEVVRCKDSKGIVTFRIACPAAGWVEVPEQRLLQWTLDIRRLVAALAASIGSDSLPNEFIPDVAWQIGAVLIAGETYQIVLVRSNSAATDGLLAELGSRIQWDRTIVVATSGDTGVTMEPSAVLSLDAAFSVVESGFEFQIERVRSAVMTQATAGGNIFQRRGDAWQIAYEDDMTFVIHEAGLDYIACLLGEPGRIIPVPILHEMVTGMPSAHLQANAEPYTTAEAVSKCANRLEELRVDRASAESMSDTSWLSRIDKEVGQIEEELSYTLGWQGQARERSEYLKVKRKIGEYIRRGKKAVADRHGALGAHLENAIKTRGGFRYEPEKATDWLTSR